MARLLTFVKHARPEKTEGVNSHDWPLSEQGRADSHKLAGHFKDKPYTAVVSSEEPKAFQTAQILAEQLSIPHKAYRNLHEHDRTNVPLMRTAEFVSAIAHFFARPHQLVLGDETAKQAIKRFEQAVDIAIADHPTGDVILVAHGTVISLWLETYCQLDGYQTWRQMGLPAFVSVTWPDCDVIERKDTV